MVLTDIMAVCGTCPHGLLACVDGFARVTCFEHVCKQSDLEPDVRNYFTINSCYIGIRMMKLVAVNCVTATRHPFIVQHHIYKP
jgi:hypothetical protein